MRPRALLLFAFVALLGAVAAGLPTLANASVVKLEVNQNCVDPEWPCWTTEGSALRPQPALKVTITEGGQVEFVDHDPNRTASVVWTSGPTTPSCPGVPTTTTASTGWEGTCSFTTPGTYHFESSTLFKESSLYGTNDYTKYEVVVAGPPTPTATTEQASGVTETEATLNGSVNPEGQATEYFFKYGETTGYGSETSHKSAGSGTTNVTVTTSPPITGLMPGRPYHFELVVTYESGKSTKLGGDRTFTTLSPPGPPTAMTEEATGVEETKATLNGTVNPDGKPTKSFFQWGTTESYGQTTPEVAAGENHSGDAALAVLTALAPGTLYHYRVVAKNTSSETTYGTDHTFTTASPPPPKEPTPPPTNPTPTPTPTPAPGPIPPEPELAPLVPAIAQGSLKLTAPRPGSSVHGSLTVFSSGAGGRLEIDLIASSASLGKARHKKSTSTVVGRLVRGSVSAGRASFSISLNAAAKRALHRRHKLTVTVKITLTPESGSADVVTKSIVLRA